ncbi:MAG: YxeA family protein [Enterococcus sp.]
MKVLKGLVGIGAVVIIGLFGMKMYTANSSDEFSAIMDQVNPLVKQGTIYVKTTDPESVNEYGTAAYKQKAVDENGKTRQIEFNGLKVLKKNHYLKLDNKGAHVEFYQEVAKEDVPQKALEVLEN